MRARGIVPYRLRLKNPSRTLRRDATPAERKLWFDFLRYLPHKFTRQKPLGSYIADFYCSSRRLVIEIDGDSHFNASSERYDAARTKSLADLGLRVIRFTNLEVMQQFEAVCERIAQALDAES
ncbi:MAG: endonuclease domain-containing protein [Burkholderiales bacterium]